MRFLVQNRGRFECPWAPLRNWSQAFQLLPIPVLTIFPTVAFTLRSSAVYGRSKWITAYMSVVGLACIALDIVSLFLLFSPLSEISVVCRPMCQDSVVRGLPIFPCTYKPCSLTSEAPTACVLFIHIAVSFEALTHLQCIESVSAPEMLSISTIIFETSSTFFTAIRCIQALRAMKKVEYQRYGVVSILLEQGDRASFFSQFPFAKTPPFL